MTSPESSRRGPATLPVLVGVLLAGIGLFLVPTLALDGQPLAAAVAVVVGLGIAALWILFLRELRQRDQEAAAREDRHALHRLLLSEAETVHLVVDPEGRVTFVSPAASRVLGLEADRLETARQLLQVLPDPLRRRALRAVSEVKKRVGAATTFQVGPLALEGRERTLEVRAVNRSDASAIGGILFAVREHRLRQSGGAGPQPVGDYRDPVTGLPNRRLLLEQCEKGLSIARRRRCTAAVLRIDLDPYGPDDALDARTRGTYLRRVADAVRRSVRDADLIGRLGDGALVVMLTEVRDADAAGRVARRILAAMPSPPAGLAGSTTPVIGVALFPEDGDQLELLLSAAGLAMNRARAVSMDVEFYRSEIRSRFTERLRLEEDLRRGLERHEFQLMYQPIHRLSTGQLVGAEALSRWLHLARGTVSASEFIELAERTGLVRSLDRWAIARAAQQQAQRREGIDWTSVNVSRRSAADGGLVDYVRGVLQEARLPPGALVLEIPADAVLDAGGREMVRRLKGAGAGIALDDFGRSAVALTGWRDLALDAVKLAPGLVADLGRGRDAEYLVEAAIALGHGIGAQVAATGVERADQVDWLRGAGCDLVQGYVIGRPVAAEDIRPTIVPARGPGD